MTNNFHSEYNGVLDAQYFIPQRALGVPTSPMTANQIKEANERLNAGVEGIEVGAIDPAKFEVIPKQHFDELRRLAKLSNAKTSMHAPIVEPAGFDRQGRWTEFQRKEVERQIKYFMERAHQLDPKGNMTMVLHGTAGTPGTVWRKVSKEEFKTLPKDEQERVKELGMQREQYITAVNQDTGQINSFEYEIRKGFGKELEIWDPKRRINNINKTQWDQEKLQIFQLEKEKLEVQRYEDMLMNSERFQTLKRLSDAGRLKRDEREEWGRLNQEIGRFESHKNELDTNVRSQLVEINKKFRKYTPKEVLERPLVRDIVKKYDDVAKVYGMQSDLRDQIIDEFNTNPEKFQKKYEKNLTIQHVYEEVGERMNKRGMPVVDERQLINYLDNLPAPEIWKPTNEFAIEKVSDTISNAAFEAYKDFGETTPVIAVENVFPETTLGRAEDLKHAIEDSRKKFAEKLMRDKKINADKAKEIAKKTIGATWDVGHINLLRKEGFSEEDIIEEAKKIAPYVKHLHLTDNFGFNDAHLVSGMGNVPTKKHIEALKDAGFEIKEGKVVMEAGQFVAELKENPHLYALEHFGSPLYSYYGEPSWRFARDTEGAYGMGFGPIMPEQHFRTYGAGFPSLPRELGGQIGEDRSRFAGTPNV